MHRLTVFDLETTGINMTAEIMQAAFVHLHVDDTGQVLETVKETEFLIKPKAFPISPEVEELTGITNEMLSNAPTIDQMAEELHSCATWGKYWVGHNIRGYDLPVLMHNLSIEHLGHSGFEIDHTEYVFLDTLSYSRKDIPHTLASMHRHYTGHDFENAHTAMADTQAALRVFEAQIAKLNSSTPDQPNRLLAFEQVIGKLADPSGVIRVNEDGKYIWTRGKKHNGKLLSEVVADTGYVEWVMGQDFSPITKKIIQAEKAAMG